METTFVVKLLDDEPGPALGQIRKALELLGGRLDPGSRTWQVRFQHGMTMQCRVDCIETVEEAERLLADPANRTTTGEEADLVLVDNNWRHAGESVDWGLQLLERTSPIPGSVNALFTIAPSADFVSRAIRAGVHSLISKRETEPFHLLNLFYVAIQQRELFQRRREDGALRESVPKSGKFESLRSDSPPMQRCIEAAIKFAPISGLNILLLGETGTGKNWLARHIHNLSPRANEPFEPIDFGQIPDELAESMLFGHEKGSFTGASEAKPGIFERALAGTVLIDEIHAIPTAVRQALLKVTDRDDRTYRRVGSTSLKRNEARIISASNREPMELRTKLRDLYPRLAGAIIELPPLRDRPEDIRWLGGRFLAEANSSFRPGAQPIEFAEESWTRLRSLPWQDNIRELRSTIERTVLSCDGLVASPEDLQIDPASREAPLTATPGAAFTENDRHRALSVRPRRGQQQRVFDLLVEKAPEPVTFAELNSHLLPPSTEDGALDVRLNHLLSRIRGRLLDVGLEVERDGHKKQYRLQRAQL